MEKLNRKIKHIHKRAINLRIRTKLEPNQAAQTGES